MLKEILEVGKRYGNLVIVREGTPNKYRARYIVVRCDCGTEFEIIWDQDQKELV